MKTAGWIRFLAVGLVSFAALVCVPSIGNAYSQGPYQMEVLINGRVASEYHFQGKRYIQARDGHEYAIRITNRTGGRVAVALSLDGLNSIDAKHTSAYDARKWVLGPYETIVINGWQTSGSTARQFYFTSEAGSYGAWLGRTRDLGNISAAFFTEEVPEPHYWSYEEQEYRGDDDGYAGSGAGASRSMDQSAQSGSAAGEATAGRGGLSSRQSERAPAVAKRSAPRDDFAATGIGREQRHSIYAVEFRHGRTPAAVVTMRYEFRDTLVKLGVLPRPYRPDPVYRRETSSGFVDFGYAPDPYGGRN